MARWQATGSLRSIRRIVRQFQKHADANFSKILAFTQHSEKTCTRCENLERENSGLIDSFQEQKKRRKRGPPVAKTASLRRLNERQPERLSPPKNWKRQGKPKKRG
ncbi:hypothetical protein EYZ11_011597 [Aspergillus tanneri]|uniref:Uncharacterized protein n=1 Tax=Aspergillus tanneri TaxID=1220188 RepID=A0A4S3J4I4_9EURO|nr:hypothetical protein EYZ11_011597 [Aspergillus tanneri]